MSSAIYLKFERSISKKDFDKFCENNEIIYSPNTIGGNVYYKGDVEIQYKEKEITVSTYHFTVGGNLPPVVEVAKCILSEFYGRYECDPEFNEIMKESIRNNYKERFIKYITDLGIELHMAESEYEGQIEMMDRWDNPDFSDPEDDARECLTYWEE